MFFLFLRTAERRDIEKAMHVCVQRDRNRISAVPVDDSDSVRERMSPAASIPTFPDESNFPRKAALLKVL